MNIINANDFSCRSELENEVRKLVDLSPDQKVGYEISGTRKELERLNLSDRTVFYGIKCVILDTPSVAKGQLEKPMRGEIKPSGINGNLTKPKQYVKYN